MEINSNYKDILENKTINMMKKISKYPQEHFKKDIEVFEFIDKINALSEESFTINKKKQKGHFPLMNKESSLIEQMKKLSKYPKDNSIVPNNNVETFIEQIYEIIELEYQVNIFDFKDNESLQKDCVNNIDSTKLNQKMRWISQDSITYLQETAKVEDPNKAKKLEKYLKSIVPEKSILEIKNISIFDNLREELPNFEEVIKFFKGSFILNQSRHKEENSYSVPTPILLLGDPGIGKTYFSQKLANILGTTFKFIDANSITANWVLSGGSDQWQSADTGEIFKSLYNSNTVSPLIVFDEIDKLTYGKNYDPFSIFLQLLEPNNAKMFSDEFLETSFDASKIIYILTANNSRNIADSLLSRMRVFNIQKASPKHTRIIAQNIYADIIGKSPLFLPKLNNLQLKKLELLTPRDIKKILSHSIYMQAADITTKKPQKLIILDSE